MIDEKKLVKHGSSYHVLVPVKLANDIKDETMVVICDLNTKSILVFPKSKSGKDIVDSFTNESLTNFLNINLQGIELRKMKIGGTP